MEHSIRTAVRDAVLAGVSDHLDGDAVQGVEWASIDDTRRVAQSRAFPVAGGVVLGPVDWAEYDAVGRAL